MGVQNTTSVTITTQDLMRVEEAAKILGKHKATIYRWHEAGQIVGVRFGGILFIPTSEIDRLKAQGERFIPLNVLVPREEIERLKEQRANE